MKLKSLAATKFLQVDVVQIRRSFFRICAFLVFEAYAVFVLHRFRNISRLLEIS